MLKEDREKLRVIRKSQPRFTEGQRQELQDVHPWLRAGRLPAALDLAVSSACCFAPRGHRPSVLAAVLCTSDF